MQAILLALLVLGSFSRLTSPPIPQYVDCIEFNEATYSDEVGWPIVVKQLIFWDSNGRIVDSLDLYCRRGKVNENDLPKPYRERKWQLTITHGHIIIAARYIHTKTNYNPEEEDAAIHPWHERKGLTGRRDFSL